MPPSPRLAVIWQEPSLEPIARRAVRTAIIGRSQESERELVDTRRRPVREGSFEMLARRLFAVTALVAATAFGAPIDPSFFQGLEWRLVGPFRGGRVLAVSGVPGEPEHFYFGAVNGGVWETLDAGRTWKPIFDDQAVGSIGALALAPSNPRVVYVGTGEADMRSDIAQGTGCIAPATAARTWVHVGLADTQQIGRILVDPRTRAGLRRGAGPSLRVQRGARRLPLPRRRGALGEGALPDEDTGAIDLAFEPGDPSVIYAALWQTRRPPWSVYPPSNGPGSGLFRSTTAGSSWSRVDGNGLPPAHGRIGLAVAPTEPGRVYAMVDAGRRAASTARTTGARTGPEWPATTAHLAARLVLRPASPSTRVVRPVYALNTDPATARSDGGRSFARPRDSPGGDDFHELWIDPGRPGPPDPRHRSGGGRDPQRRPDLELLAQPADRADLPRLHRQPLPLLGLRRPAGLGRCRPTEPHHRNRAGINARASSARSRPAARATTSCPTRATPRSSSAAGSSKLDLRTMQTREIDPTLA